MRLLLDSCISGRAAAVLREAGHDVVWTGDWIKDPGDEEILASARAESRTLITLDKDFGELAVARGVSESHTRVFTRRYVTTISRSSQAGGEGR